MNSPKTPDPLQSRLDNLAKALDVERGTSQKADLDDAHLQSTGSAMILGVRVLVEFVVVICVGALLGWQLDFWFGTAPVGLIALLVLGTVAGFYSIYRKAAAPTGKTRR